MPLDNKIDFKKEKRSMRAYDMVFNATGTKSPIKSRIFIGSTIM